MLRSRLAMHRGQLRRHRQLVPIRRLIVQPRLAHLISREDLGATVHPSLDASTSSLHPGSATIHLRLKVPLILAQLTGGIVVPTLVPDPTTANLVKLVPQLVRCGYQHAGVRADVRWHASQHDGGCYATTTQRRGTQ